jgi:hypothetical protein
MENAAKALEIAAGVLLALMIMSLFAFFFTKLGVWPEEQDEMESTEQLAKFNLEYEVYQKSAMYGVDVISCLNKAKSNNEKYAEGGSFFEGLMYENKAYSKYYIDVYVHMESNLEETLEIYYMNGSNKNVQCFSRTDSEIGSKFTMDYAGFEFQSDYTEFNSNTKLNPSTKDLTDGSKYLVKDGGTQKTITIDGKNVVDNTYYSLRNDSENRLSNLLELNISGNNMSIIKTNTTGKDYDVWTKAVWYTALYNFKTKRFKCDYIGYSTVTGRVNEIYFSEIK